MLDNSLPAGNYIFKVNHRNSRTRCEICLKLTIKTPERDANVHITKLNTDRKKDNEYRQIDKLIVFNTYWLCFISFKMSLYMWKFK